MMIIMSMIVIIIVVVISNNNSNNDDTSSNNNNNNNNSSSNDNNSNSNSNSATSVLAVSRLAVLTSRSLFVCVLLPFCQRSVSKIMLSVSGAMLSAVHTRRVDATAAIADRLHQHAGDGVLVRGHALALHVLAALSSFIGYMRNLLGWLEIRLAQNTFN